MLLDRNRLYSGCIELWGILSLYCSGAGLMLIHRDQQMSWVNTCSSAAVLFFRVGSILRLRVRIFFSNTQA